MDPILSKCSSSQAVSACQVSKKICQLVFELSFCQTEKQTLVNVGENSLGGGKHQGTPLRCAFICLFPAIASFTYDLLDFGLV